MNLLVILPAALSSLRTRAPSRNGAIPRRTAICPAG